MRMSDWSSDVCSSDRFSRHRFRQLGDLRSRELDGEARALARRRLAGELAAVSPRDPVHQRQAEAETAEAPRGRRIALAEVVEDRAEPLGRYANALVGDQIGRAHV